MPAMKRALLVVTHLLGVGHFARMAALGRALAAKGWKVTIASGGRPVSTVDTDGIEIVQLPPVQCRNADFSKLLDANGEVIAPRLLTERARLLCSTFETLDPDVVILELYPFGRRALADEFEILLAAARARNPRPLLLCSVRDVLNPPSKPGRAETVLKKLAVFDGILVHGDQILPLDTSWPVTPDLARQLHYVGYLRDAGRDEASTDTAVPRDGVVVSAGGSDAGLALCRAAIEAAGILSDEPWHVLVSQAIAPKALAALQDEAPTHVVVEPARRDFPTLLARCSVSISQAGYNTVLDLAATGPRAVLVPFAAGQEQEQTLRAEAMAARRLARIVPEAALTGEALAQAVRTVRSDPAPDWSAIHLDGAERAVATIDTLSLQNAEIAQAWLRLEGLLAHAAKSGETIEIWIRDDDAVAVTPALERFLAQLARFRLPAGLAAIPAHADAGLAERLSQNPGISVLVHGHAHTNHADAGQKAAEFGEGRSVAAMASEAGDSLRRIADRFGAIALPVFVPPWNRIDPAFARMLPELGYLGLSTFADRKEADGASGIIQANAHWDPIDWRGSRGLKPRAKLITDLLAIIEARLATPGNAREPIGLLTHHLVHDGWVESFLDDLFARLHATPAVRFLPVPRVFGLTAQ